MITQTLLLTGLVYIIIGCFAGLMAGTLGIGGGVVVVPGLLFVFERLQIIPADATMHAATGTSLAVMIITAQSSLRAHLKMGPILWPVFKKMVMEIFFGSIAGALMATFISTFWLTKIFGLFLITVGIKMYTDIHVTHVRRNPPTWFNRVISFLIGFKSGLLGVGGGVLIVPYLTYIGVEVRQIAAISTLCTLTVALVGSIMFMITGWQHMHEVALATGYVYWPAVLCVAIPSSFFAPLGAKLNYVLPIKHLKYFFIVILAITAISMFW